MDRDIAAQFAAMGVDVAGPAADDEEAFELMPANLETMHAWIACATQWRTIAGMAGIVMAGLDYAGVDVVLRRLGFTNQDAVFRDLMVMEDAALSAFAEVRR